MNTLADKLHKWSVEELNLVSEGRVKTIPDSDSLRTLTKGKNKKIWNYVINHVRSESAVNNIKRTLYIKKLLKEKEDNASSVNDNSVDLVKLKSSVAKATEKRTYLMRTLSTVEERLQNLEQNIQNTKDETFQTNQKAAFLELLQQQLAEKSLLARNLYSQILLHKNRLISYQSTKVCNEIVAALPYGFQNVNVDDCNENISGIKDLIDTISAYKKNYNDSTENFCKSNVFKTNGLLLTDVVLLLKEISASDLQQFTATNLQGSSVKDSMIYENKKNSSKVLLSQLKCKNVYNAVNAIKNRKRVEKLVVIKEKIFEDKIKDAKFNPNDLDFELKCTLVEKLAENEALVTSNNYLDNYLTHTSNEINIILVKLHNQKLFNDEQSAVSEKFYNMIDLTYYLMYTASNVFKKVLDDLNDLQSFVYKDLFMSPFPEKECLEGLKTRLISDRMQTWSYCDKTNLLKPHFSKQCANDSLSSEVLGSLNLEPLQNISFLCEKWTHIKQKLRREVIAHSETFVQNKSVNVSEMYAKFLNMLETMKFSIDKGLLFVTEGMTFCNKTKCEVQEWWEQNAQYIPHIEYEGKTLKMWIDILAVLSQFEPQNYSQD